MEKRKILVTGGTGLLGSYLIRALLMENKEVKALYRHQYPQLLTTEEIGRVEWRKGDILDISSLQDAMTEVTNVYHCAGMVSFNPERAEDMMKINVEGTANVVNVSLESGVQKLVHVSSVSALGRKRNHSTINELVKWDEDANLSEYGNSKYLAEMEVWRGISEGLDAVIVNPAIILGVGDWHKGSSAMFKNAFNEFPWFTDGTSGFIDVKDVALIMIRLMQNEISAERYILSAETRSYKDIFTKMALAFGKNPPHKKATHFLSGIVWRWEKLKSFLSKAEPLLTRETAETAHMHVSYDNSKILKILPGFQFRSIDESIAEYSREYLVKINSRPQ